MRIDLTYAALSDTIDQRVRLAANTLGAHRIRARAAPWDGTQCDVVVANADDVYGRHVIELAQRRRIGVLAIGEHAVDADETLNPAAATIAAISRALHTIIVSRATNEPAAHAEPDARPPSAAAAASALVRLSSDPRLADVDLEASLPGARLWLLPGSGRVLSATVAEQLRARTALGGDGWTFTPLGPRRRDPPIGEISSSLDAFYLHGAWAARASLPAFPDMEAVLRDWPDLGGATDIVDALSVAKALLRGGTGIERLSALSGVPRREVCACLWAFSASGVLTRRPSPQPLPAAPRRTAATGLFVRLAAHFGLRRR